MNTKTKERPNLLMHVFASLIVLMSIPIFQALPKWLGIFIWPFTPWGEGWLIIPYTALWFYTLLAWAFFWIAQYVIWLSFVPIAWSAYKTVKEKGTKSLV